MTSLNGFIIATILLAILPGPDIMFVITQGITNGKKSAIMTATGLCCGCTFHTVLAAYGISIIFKQSHIAYNILQFFGISYLIYLALKSFKTKFSLEEKANLKGGFQKGILMNILNPKVALFFIAFLPQFVPQNTNSYVFHMILLGIIFAVISFCVFTICAILAAQFNSFMKENQIFQKYINKIAGIFYIMIACSLLFL